MQKSVNFELWVVQKRVHCADLEKCCKMSIYLQNSASIQLRTSHKKVKNSSRKSHDPRVLVVAEPSVGAHRDAHLGSRYGRKDRPYYSYADSVQKSVEILSEIRKICRISAEIRKFAEFFEF